MILIKEYQNARKPFRANPFSLSFDAKTTALVMIDMQRDFVEPGGFGEALGNDVFLVRSAIVPCGKVLKAAYDSKLLVIHTREPSSRPDRLPTRETDPGRQDLHWRRRSNGPCPGARRSRSRHHSRAVTRRRANRLSTNPARARSMKPICS